MLLMNPALRLQGIVARVRIRCGFRRLCMRLCMTRRSLLIPSILRMGSSLLCIVLVIRKFSLLRWLCDELLTLMVEDWVRCTWRLPVWVGKRCPPTRYGRSGDQLLQRDVSGSEIAAQRHCYRMHQGTASRGGYWYRYLYVWFLHCHILKLTCVLGLKELPGGFVIQ
jgi:hypothetical protein